jgi:hypothetical protein
VYETRYASCFYSVPSHRVRRQRLRLPSALFLSSPTGLHLSFCARKKSMFLRHTYAKWIMIGDPLLKGFNRRLNGSVACYSLDRICCCPGVSCRASSANKFTARQAKQKLSSSISDPVLGEVRGSSEGREPDNGMASARALITRNKDGTVRKRLFPLTLCLY